MKIWFDYNYIYEDPDFDMKLGIGWYKHHHSFKWKGLTVKFYLFFWLISVTFVSNWNEYDKKVNYRKYRDKK